MKWLLLKAIARNIGMLGSYDFWKLVFTDRDFPVKSILFLVLFAGCADILRIVFIPGYPGNTAE